MIKVSGDLSNINNYVGAVGGILTAMQSPAVKGRFIDSVTSEVKKSFMADTIAANQSGYANLSHVFEWPKQNAEGVSLGEPSKEPLFKLTKVGTGPTRIVSYEFLPSTKPVPLPDPERYGFDPEKLQFLRRHVFRMKALVMETNSAVNVAPVEANRLFIPTTRSARGYIMTGRAVTVNPGGERATGGFSHWWNDWFEVSAQQIVDRKVQVAEDWVAKTGKRIVRDATTGRFAKATPVSIGYVEGVARSAQMKMDTAAAMEFDDEW